MSSLVDDIIDLSRIEFNRFELYPNWFDVHEMVRDIFNLISFQITRKNIELKYEISPKVPTELFSDMKRIKQVLLNLMTNAIKFT